MSFLGIAVAVSSYDQDKQGYDKLIVDRTTGWWVIGCVFFRRLYHRPGSSQPLRFDFANHAESTRSPAPVTAAEAVPAPVAEALDEQLTTGVGRTWKF